MVTGRPMVEFQAGTNPLITEEARDDDRDGFTNLDEVREHTDPESADLAFHAEHAYGYQITPTTPTVDGQRLLPTSEIINVGLVHNFAPSPPVQTIPATPDGMNNLSRHLLRGG